MQWRSDPIISDGLLRADGLVSFPEYELSRVVYELSQSSLRSVKSVESVQMVLGIQWYGF